MKKRQFNANLRVQVTIDVDGSHTEKLLRGSGDDEIDQLVLNAMRRWKWRAAYKDGEKSKQVLTFQYKININ
jgi:TonB family protein